MEQQTYPDGVADQVMQRRVCSRCYGDLGKRPAGRDWTLVCPKCGNAWGGTTVSRSYAIQLGQRNLNEYLEAKYNLPDLFPVRRQNEADIMRDLGF